MPVLPLLPVLLLQKRVHQFVTFRNCFGSFIASHVLNSYIGYRAHSSGFKSFREGSKDHASKAVNRSCSSAPLQD